MSRSEHFRLGAVPHEQMLSLARAEADMHLANIHEHIENLPGSQGETAFASRHVTSTREKMTPIVSHKVSKIPGNRFSRDWN